MNRETLNFDGRDGNPLTVDIHVGDCLESLRAMPDNSVHCVVTSPPYFGLRDYGVDGQIGLEPTPDEFVAALVAVFREVRRVLRDDGTLWLNLGDSYASGTKESGGAGKSTLGPKRDLQNIDFQKMEPRRFACGLADKQLIGIPWRVAFALQQPWYSGRITKEIDRMWLAAMIDGEGCMFIHKRKAGTDSGAKFTKADGTEISYERKQDTYSPGLEVANTHLGIVERCQQITGLGTITRQDKDRRLPLYRWHLRAGEARQIVREVYPYLIGKRQQARILCGCPTSGEQADAAHQALMLLHNGALTDVDFKDPASMHEPGWYLRQDVIWSKPNPMPESVRDRCTKAHEYLFLLTKGPRYYFDSEAIKEPAVSGATGAAASFKRTGSKREQPIPGQGYGTHRPDREDVAYNQTRNRRSVWSVPTRPFPGAHFATFPPDLIEPCILAGTSARGACPHCGAGWKRVSERPAPPSVGDSELDRFGNGSAGVHRKVEQAYQNWLNENPVVTVGWQPACQCLAHDPVSAVVLDPFGGSGTTAGVAIKHGRNAVVCELNPEYAELIPGRIESIAQAPQQRLRRPKVAPAVEQVGLFEVSL